MHDEPLATEEEIQRLVYRYTVGELTDVQFNFYVQTWKLDREYVNLLLSDAERAKQAFIQAKAGCIVLVFIAVLAFVMYFLLGIS